MALTLGFIVTLGEGRGEAAVGWDGVALGSFRAGIQSRATSKLPLILKRASCMPDICLNVTHIISLNIILPCGVRCSYPHCPVGETEAVEVKQTCPRSCSGWRAEQGLSPAALAPKPMGLTATLYPPLGRAGNCPRALGEVQWVRWRLSYTGPPRTQIPSVSSSMLCG